MRKRQGIQSSSIRGVHEEIEIEYEEMSLDEFFKSKPTYAYGRRLVEVRAEKLKKEKEKKEKKEKKGKK